MEYKNHIRILYGLVVLLMIGVAGMALAWHESERQILLATASSSAPSADLSGVAVGGANTPPLSVAGAVTALGSNSLKVKNIQNTVTAVVVNADTKIEKLGPQKDAATVQQEFAAYNAKVAELMKDPQTNKAALAAMQAPIPQTFVAMNFADLKVGDQVQINANTTDASGAYVATLVIMVGTTPQQ
jgi:uncharacterized protein GlcG (DUF336 family)